MVVAWESLFLLMSALLVVTQGTSPDDNVRTNLLQPSRLVKRYTGNSEAKPVGLSASNLKCPEGTFRFANRCRPIVKPTEPTSSQKEDKGGSTTDNSLNGLSISRFGSLRRACSDGYVRIQVGNSYKCVEISQDDDDDLQEG